MRNSEIHNQIYPRLQSLREFTADKKCQNFNTNEICEYFSPETNQFLEEINPDFKTYLNCLNSVIRWKEHYFQEMTNAFTETDYDHVLAMLKINSEIKDLEIPSINYSETELMILLHDGGEIVTDDMSVIHLSSKDEFFRKIKKIEPKLFHKFILNKTEDPDKKEYLTDLYNKYENRQNNPDDTNSHLVKLIDIFQGNVFGIENVYHKEKLIEVYGSEFIQNKADLIVKNMIQIEINQTTLVLSSIKDSDDKQKLYEHINQKFLSEDRYIEAGYKDVYCEFKSSLIFLNPSFGPSCSK